MNSQIEKIAEQLNLTPYQKAILSVAGKKYNMSRLEKRGGLLYAPYNAKNLMDFFRGCRADLIGRNKTLLCGHRGIKFYSAGFHAVRIGRNMYYADNNGAAISRCAFMRGIAAAKSV